MDQTIVLTSTERARMENQKQLYVLLKMINLTQKYYSYDKIDSTTYKSQISKYIEKYNRFSQVIPNFRLEDFLKKYNVSHDEVSWAKLVLQKGIHSQENQSKQTFLFMQATVKFIQVFDLFSEYQRKLDRPGENCSLIQLKTPLQQLNLFLKKISVKLGSQFKQKLNEYQRMYQKYVTSKSINESIPMQQLKQMWVTLDGMYRMMEIIVRNN